MLSSLSPSVDSLSSLILLLGPRLYPMCLAQCAGLHLCCQIHVQFRTLLARFRFPFCRFVVVHSSRVHLVWLYDHHLRRVLVASYRPPFVLIRPYSDTGHAASDCIVGKTVPCYPPHCKSAPTTRSRLVSPSNHPASSSCNRNIRAVYSTGQL